MPQFVPGRNNVVVDALSHPNKVIGSEWMLHQKVFDWLRKRRPVTIDLFASSLSHCCSIYFAPVSDSMAAGMDAMLQSWDSLQAYAFPHFAMITWVLMKSLSMTDCSLLATTSMVFQAAGAVDGASSSSFIPVGPPAAAARQEFYQSLSMLRLHAWRLSSDLQESPASLEVWLADLGKQRELRQ